MPRHWTINADLSGQLKKAHAAHVEGALAQAEKLYRAILQHHPDSFDVVPTANSIWLASNAESGDASAQ